MKKIISNINHHVDDYECMWNGIEDLYMHKTHILLPEQFFFIMSGFGSFVYMNTPKQSLKKFVGFGDGRTQKMYDFLSPIVNFDYHFVSSSTSELALAKAKKEIDNDYPVVLGTLDMFYLPYFKKIYQQQHIPLHYVLMIGYDDDKQEIYLYDCGRSGITTLSYSNLFLAFNAMYPGLSKPNTIIKIRMENPNDFKYITYKSLSIKVDNYLNPQTKFLGYLGLEKFAKELPSWEATLGIVETKKILSNLVMFFGSVPTTPNKLLKINEPDDILFKCSRDKMSKVLLSLNTIFPNEDDLFLKASKLFEESGNHFEKIKEYFIEYILDDKNTLEICKDELLLINSLEIEAYKLIKKVLMKG